MVIPLNFIALQNCIKLKWQLLNEMFQSSKCLFNPMIASLFKGAIICYAIKIIVFKNLVKVYGTNNSTVIYITTDYLYDFLGTFIK